MFDCQLSPLLGEKSDNFTFPREILICTVWGPVSGHKRRKHAFRTSEGRQSAEINTDSNFSIKETGVKLTAA